MWILEASEPFEMKFRLRAGHVRTLGRAPRAEFRVEAPLVSRLHCRVTGRDDSVEVVDLSSTNGTYVNGRKVKKAELKAGDRLRVGRVEMQLSKNR